MLVGAREHGGFWSEFFSFAGLDRHVSSGFLDRKAECKAVKLFKLRPCSAAAHGSTT